jgi:predicted GIY-YIG superfamily endonuclease
MTEIIYVLRCEGDKYYVGRTTDFKKRYKRHCAGIAASWTKKHPPIEWVEQIALTSDFQEDITTKEYMRHYGVDNVRGGSYTTIELSTTQRESIAKEIKTAYNLCYECSSPDHFRSVCPLLNKPISPSELPGGWRRKDPRVCLHCGRPGHVSSMCFAKTNKAGISLRCDGRHCWRCGRTGHMIDDCRATTSFHGKELKSKFGYAGYDFSSSGEGNSPEVGLCRT